MTFSSNEVLITEPLSADINNSFNLWCCRLGDRKGMWTAL